MVWAFFVFIIVMAGIGLGAFAVWLDFKKEAKNLGGSTKDLEREVAALRELLVEQGQRSERRLQNLEAIVTSHEWDQLKSGEAPLREQFLEITKERGESLEEETTRIARRVSE